MTSEQLRDEVADAINEIEAATDEIIVALRALERDHNLGVGHARTAHDMIDMMSQLNAILEDIDQQLRERKQ